MNIKPNRLITQKSPYLLQHAHNPVDWFPWGEEAFAKARSEDKPVFLSIGYSTCHWCHVMEHESFEDNVIAELMNKFFVSIKVDREERPDIDGIYMNVCQMLTGSGGWPLTIIMTPDKKPFFAGTYFPKEGRFGKIGMSELLPRINELWLTRKEDINKSANEITNALRTNYGGEKSEPGEKIFDEAYSHFIHLYDAENGGFGNAPKFPSPHNLMFLLRYSNRKNDSRALEMAAATLKKMRLGGIYDQIGYGFHRYSTDARWLVPHFEKMLYDQALLSLAYTEAYQATGEDIFRSTAEETLIYVGRDMTSHEGGFYSAEDADSEGEEGKFYLWKEEEVKNILGNEYDLMQKIFNILPEGNWTAHTSGQKNGTNIPYLNNDIKILAVEMNIDYGTLLHKIKSAREKLFERRRKRVHPHKDDKILTDWNGLMISAFAKAYQVFGKTEYLTSAENAAGFILDRLSNKEGMLLHRYRDGEAGITGLLDDYSFFISALIDLYESNFEISYLEKAISFNDYLLLHFRDEKDGGFYVSGDDSNDLPVRQKEFYDGAVPSGNSTVLMNLLRLGRITGNTKLEEEAFRVAGAFSKNLAGTPFAFTNTLSALVFAFGPTFELVISGDKNSPDTELFLKKIRELFIPGKVIILNNGGRIHKIAPFTENKPMTDNKTTLYVCRNFNCKFPTTSPDDIPGIFYDNSY